DPTTRCSSGSATGPSCSEAAGSSRTMTSARCGVPTWEIPPEPRDRLPHLPQGSETIGTESAGTVVLGAGPAGLTAAHVLGRRGVRATVFEADGVVGGIAKTVEFNGYRF